MRLSFKSLILNFKIAIRDDLVENYSLNKKLKNTYVHEALIKKDHIIDVVYLFLFRIVLSEYSGETRKFQ